MRQKAEAVLSFWSSDEGLPKVVRQYRARYRAISQVLDANPEILTMVHKDLAKLSQGGSKGRRGDYTSENILRALIVQHLEGLPFRETVVRIGSDPFLQDFLRMRKRAVMDFGFLDKCFLVIRPQTWRRINELLARHGVAQGKISPDVLRADTTVVESNIHYPTDASLLWDTWRVASRLLKRAREIDRASMFHRFHDRKIKRLYLYVTRYMPSKSAARQRRCKGVPHADRANRVDRDDCRGVLRETREVERSRPGGGGPGTEVVSAGHAKGCDNRAAGAV